MLSNSSAVVPLSDQRIGCSYNLIVFGGRMVDDGFDDATSKYVCYLPSLRRRLTTAHSVRLDKPLSNWCDQGFS